MKVGLVVTLTDQAGNKIKELNVNVDKLKVKAKEAGQAGTSAFDGMGASAEVMGQKTGKQFMSLDSMISKTMSKWSKFAMSMVLAGGGVKVIMDLMKWTQDYEKNLSALAERHDAVGAAAQRLYGNMGDLNKATEQMHTAIGALGFEFEKSMVEGMGKSVKKTEDLRDGILKMAPIADFLGNLVGMVVKGWNLILTQSGSIIKWLVEVVMKYAFLPLQLLMGAIENAIKGMAKLAEYAGMKGTSDALNKIALEIGNTSKLITVWAEEAGKSLAEAFQIDPKKFADLKTVVTHSAEEMKKIDEEAAKAAKARWQEELKGLEAAAKDYEETMKAKEKYQQITTELMQYVHEHPLKVPLEIEMPEAGKRAIQYGGFLDFMGITKTNEDMKKLDDMKQSIEGMWLSGTITEDQYKSGLSKVKEEQDKLKDKTKDYGAVVTQVFADAITAVGNFFTKLIGGNSQISQMFSKLGGGLGAVWGSAEGGLGKAMKSVFGKIGSTLAPVVGEVIGSIAGALFGKIFSLFAGKPDWKKLAEDIGSKMGIQISDELAKQIDALAKKLGSKERAEAQSLKAIVGDILSTSDFGKAMGAINAVLADYSRGVVTAADASKGIGEVFSEMANVVGDDLSPSLIKLIQQTDKAGLRVKEIAEYVAAALKQEAAGINSWADAVKQMYEAGTMSLDEYKKQMKEITAMSQQTFEAMIRGGQTVMQAWESLGAGAPYQKLIEANKLMLQMIDAQNEAYKGLGKTGNFTLTDFSNFQKNISANYNDLIAKGFSQKLALEAIAPSLQTLIGLSNSYTFQIDDATKGLIDQAKQQDLLNGKAINNQTVMLGLLERIAIQLGAKIPDAWDRFINGAEEAANAVSKVADEASRIGIAYPMGKGGKGGYNAEGFQEGGIFDVNKKSMFMAGEAGRERVIVLKNPKDIEGPVPGTGGKQEINITQDITTTMLDENFCKTKLIPMILGALAKNTGLTDKLNKTLKGKGK